MIETDGHEPTVPPAEDVDRARTWRRLRRMAAPRATKANALALLLAISLGFAIATQIRQNQAAGLANLRQDELVRVLDDLTQRSARLDQQVRDLQAQRDRLTSGNDSSTEVAAAAQRRLDQLGLLAGTVKAQGPGIRLTIDDPSRTVKSTLLLDVLQELRDAGAEVVQIGAVRVVAGSSFADVPGPTVTLDGQSLDRPFVVLAIGDSQTLATALAIPGGIVDTVRRSGASARIEQVAALRIDALRAPTQPRFAQPVAPASASPTK
ncbi:MAG: DUF881 domain-containing protein [Dermatophilaceae bacterium]